MPSSQLFGKILFLLSAALLVWAAFEPRPRSPFGRRWGVLVAGALVLGNLHAVLAMSETLQNVATAGGLVLIAVAVFSRAKAH